MATVRPPDGSADGYRDFDEPARDTVRAFYRENHARQTHALVGEKRAAFLPPRRERIGVLDALERLDAIVDDSDPDIELGQLAHALQTAEAIRADAHEDWFVLAGLVHDLGKVLCGFGEPQWAVVGDTFPVGCAFSDRIVYPEYFAANPDASDPRYSTPLGVYERGCGLRNVWFSWGHDEYLFHVLGEHLPEPARYMIRFHSCYAWHREGAYEDLLDAHDRDMLPWVQRFNAYDLYSKTPDPPSWPDLRPYYASLVERYLPDVLVF